MPTWDEIARYNFETARRLTESPGADYRSATSRFYYAAFSLVTHELIRRLAQADFRDGRATPGHAQLPLLIERHFKQFTEERRANLARLVNELYRQRLASDYSSSRVDRALARSSHENAEKVFKRLGIQI